MIKVEHQVLAHHDLTGSHPQSWANQPASAIHSRESSKDVSPSPGMPKPDKDVPVSSKRAGDNGAASLQAIRHWVYPEDIDAKSTATSVDERYLEGSKDHEDMSGAIMLVANGIEAHKRRQSQVEDIAAEEPEKEKVLKLSPAKIFEFVSSPESLPIRPLLKQTSSSETLQKVLSEAVPTKLVIPEIQKLDRENHTEGILQPDNTPALVTSPNYNSPRLQEPVLLQALPLDKSERFVAEMLRPSPPTRSLSTPLSARSPRPKTTLDGRRSSNKGLKEDTAGFDFNSTKLKFDPSIVDNALPSPMPASIPVPPLSIPTYLQLELSSQRPSPLYIHRSSTNDFPYESSRVKIERLLNFIFLPYYLEGALVFGSLACFDAWLYTFTILPLRLLKSFYILGESWAANLASEIQFVCGFVYQGTMRMWRRRHSRRIPSSEKDRSTATSIASEKPEAEAAVKAPGPLLAKAPSSRIDWKVSGDEGGRVPPKLRRHRRSKSVPSALLPDDKADILKGFLIICTCLILMRFDASRMYHWIRGQAAIKLYVIYNVLEVCDRLFSAIGQDVLECLFSREALERKPNGHSKILRPFWLFIMALVYTVIHSTALFYQVITLNVAVNSYSNALITLLMSNQFVEIKSTVFKKFEKENLFQLTCADVVERFQLWLMLTIIASRNIVETGGLSMGFSALGSSSPLFATPSATNSSSPLTQAMPPRSSSSILPRSFELLPALFNSLTAYAPTVGHVLGPFLVVLGSEMLVDWLKHAYISKFNNTRPAIYSRFLDVLAKDYYSNAFGDQNLTKRLGLPVIPLSCLFIRASVQTYHMFVAAWIPAPMPSSATSLTNMHKHYTTSGSRPTSTAVALSQKLDVFLRQLPASVSSSNLYRHFTTILVVLLLFLVLLATKLVLGMVLLSFSRSRYRSMKEREKDPVHHVEGGRRVGGWGVVEVDEDKRRWIYDDDAEGAKALREREDRDRAKQQKGTGEAAFDKVKRYEMVAKRIW